MLSLCACVVATSAVLGQAPAPPSNYEHLKDLEWLVGSWEANVKAEDEVPGVVKQGDPVKIALACEWALGKNVIAVSFAVTAHGVTLMEHRGMIGWDAAEKQVVSGGFNSLGGHGHATWSKTGGQWRIKGAGVEGDGTKTQETMVFSNISEDSFTSQTLDRSEGGEPQADGEKTVWKKSG
jgi:hypothetical protein